MAVRPEINKLDIAARKAESARDAAQSEIAYIDERKASKRKLTGAAERKLDEKRASLEAKLPSLVADAEAARAQWQVAADAAKPLETAMMGAEAARRAAFAEYSKANAELSRALSEEEAIKRQDAKRAYPVSVFVSRKTQRLYVRQGYAPILDVPVTFERPDEVIGTARVHGARPYAEQDGDVLVGGVDPDDPVEQSRQQEIEKGARRRKPRPPLPVPASQQTAAAALDRITIPEEARDRIADVMKPGSSLDHLRQRHERRDRRVHGLHRVAALTAEARE